MGVAATLLLVDSAVMLSMPQTQQALDAGIRDIESTFSGYSSTVVPKGNWTGYGNINDILDRYTNPNVITEDGIAIPKTKGNISESTKKKIKAGLTIVTASALTKALKDPNPPGPVLYHYTNKENAMAIMASGKILPDSRNRVFLTPERYSKNEVNNALFMGQKNDSYGEYRVTVSFYSGNDPLLNKFGATQPNEIIYHGTIRNGRNATIFVEENDFE